MKADDFRQDPGPDLPPLGRDVHAWRIILDRPEWSIEDLKPILSDTERTRAARFYAARDRDRFIVGRGMLRTILGRYLGIAPDRLTFDAGPHGKPGLVGEHGGLEFNLTHSHGLAVLAIAVGRRVGVDIESIRPVREIENLVVRFFSPRERAEFVTVAPDRKLAAFFQAWTRKEAYIKAIGTGLATPLDSFDVGVDPDSAPGLIGVKGKPDEPGRWTMRDFDPGAGFLGAIVVEGSGWGLLGFEDGRAGA